MSKQFRLPLPDSREPFLCSFSMSTEVLIFTHPTTWQIPDLHWLETCAAGRTTKKRQSVMTVFLFPKTEKTANCFLIQKQITALPLVLFSYCDYASTGSRFLI